MNNDNTPIMLTNSEGTSYPFVSAGGGSGSITFVTGAGHDEKDEINGSPMVIDQQHSFTFQEVNSKLSSYERSFRGSKLEYERSVSARHVNSTALDVFLLSFLLVLVLIRPFVSKLIGIK